MTTRAYFRALFLYLSTLYQNKPAFYGLLLIQGVLIGADSLFPLVFAALVAVLTHPDLSQLPGYIPMAVRNVVAKASVLHLALGLLAVMFVLDMVRGYLHKVFQDELRLRANWVRRRLINRALTNFLNKDHLFRARENPVQLKRLVDELDGALDSLQTGVMGRAIPTLLEAAIAFAVIATLFDPSYALLFALLLVFGIGYSIWSAGAVRKGHEQAYEAMMQANRAVADGLVHHDQVVSSGGVRPILAEIDLGLHGFDERVRALLGTQRRLGLLQSLSVFGVLYVILAMTVTGIVSGAQSVAALVLMTTYFFQFAMPIEWLGIFLRFSMEHAKIIDRFASAFDLDASITEPREADQLPSLSEPSIEVKDLVLRLQKPKANSEPEEGARAAAKAAAQSPSFLLSVPSFNLKGAMDVAFVGHNGAGKSTFARLLAGHLQLDQGRVEVNRRMPYEMAPDARAQLVRYLPQSSTLLARGLAANIAFPQSPLSVERESLTQLIRQLPNNERLLEVLNGEDEDLHLSGGETQKALLLRAALNPSPVMIFDEAQSELDLGALAESRALLRRVNPKGLLIYVTHSLEFARQCDWVVSFADGRIDGEGEPESLLAEGTSWFAKTLIANGFAR